MRQLQSGNSLDHASNFARSHVALAPGSLMQAARLKRLLDKYASPVAPAVRYRDEGRSCQCGALQRFDCGERIS